MSGTNRINNYIFELSEKVTRKSVSYKNRFGITIAADLYLPKVCDVSKKHAAIIVGAPYGGVKEQGPGIYAQNMAERGFSFPSKNSSPFSMTI